MKIGQACDYWRQRRSHHSRSSLADKKVLGALHSKWTVNNAALRGCCLCFEAVRSLRGSLPAPGSRLSCTERD